MRRICITTGDPDGIGFEVADKALAGLGTVQDVQFLLWRHQQDPQSLSAQVQSRFKLRQVRSLREAFGVSPDEFSLVEIHSSEPPIEWVRQSAIAALSGEVDALCTGPLSKTSPGAEGGHTGLFRSLVSEPLFMLFLGSKFNVVLLTDHIPLTEVESHLSPSLIQDCIRQLDRFKKSHPVYFSKASIQILGLNPHAGERGLIGTWEQKVLLPTLSKLHQAGFSVEGPLVPDAAFVASLANAPCFYVALYHDQGLIPFKLAHGYNEGIQLTLGLPFVRTSVDHGTAKELFGKNSADAGSMRDALEWALKLTGIKN